MYGMVNRAVEEMVTSHFGNDTWLEIKRVAEVDTEVFVSLEAYPDDVTYRLVGAASEVLGLPSEQILEEFGQYWVLHTARDGYGSLLDAGGATLPEFMRNLPGLHARVALIFPNLKPPTFAVSDETPNSITVHYRSSRTGLQPMVFGLLKGVAARFQTEATITRLQSYEDGADHDVYLMQW